MTALLLDTCAIIYIATGRAMRAEAHREIRVASLGDGILVSPISAWEIGLLCSRRGMAFDPDPKTWFRRFMDYPGVRLAALTPEIGIDSSLLPSPPELHGDPADRLLIATARALDVPIVTRDRHILDYARTSVMRAVRC
jgi:PIN domain nuclease of toxin-antitoxin system